MTRQSIPSILAMRHRHLALQLAAVLGTIVAGSAHADVHVSLWDGVDSYSVSAPVALAQTISSSNSGVQATALGSADLASGTLRSAIDGEALVCCATAGVANSTAQVTDTLTFHGAGPSVLVEMTMLVDGSFSMTGTAGGSIDVRVNASLSLLPGLTSYPGGSSNLNLDRYYQTGGVDSIDGSVTGSPGSFLDKSLAGASAALVLSVLMPTERPVPFRAAISNGNTVAAPLLVFDSDFSHTAQLSMSLPTGYSYTSGSGVFLTTSPVPEPAALPLMLAGLVGIGARWALRRRRQLVPRACARSACVSAAGATPSDDCSSSRQRA